MQQTSHHYRCEETKEEEDRSIGEEGTSLLLIEQSIDYFPSSTNGGLPFMKPEHEGYGSRVISQAANGEEDARSSPF